MNTHHFSIHIPNQTDHAVSVNLHLEKAKMKEVQALHITIPKGELKVINYGISLETCGIEGPKSIKLKLEPYSSRDVNVFITTAATQTKSAAFYELVDERAGNIVGGVLLVCYNASMPEPAGQVVTTGNLCPVKLYQDVYPVQPGDDPSKAPQQTVMQQGKSYDLVAAITNPTNKVVKNVVVYLEHMGLSDTEFLPGTYNVGDMQPGHVFYASWPINVTGWKNGNFNASVVVNSERANAVRISSKVEIGRERKTKISEGKLIGKKTRKMESA